MVYSHKKKYPEAKQQYEEAYLSLRLGPDHPSLLTIQSKIALVLVDPGQRESALTMFEAISHRNAGRLGQGPSGHFKRKKKTD
ncbi:hypothetical protein JTE90_006085 [Oedothorax gibbosus]|uniref:Kinesin light chain n=1 Tax=Oedothorax gibbosus TaxID=931172 RepID=A0AAV6V3X1_9ARAC|nr:hypothetical protein JTE90_006085 [Oedothorax gibbosus]